MVARTSTHTRQTLSASTLAGDKVINSKGEKLGKVEDIMIDVDTGRVAYVVLSFGGFMGIGDKLFAIPWQAMRVDERQHCFVLDMDKSRLERAPGFDKSNWPDMSDPAFGSQVHSYYNVTPYWE